MNETVQGLKVEIKSTKQKPQTEGNKKLKTLIPRSGTSEARLSTTDYKRQEKESKTKQKKMGTSVKENVKFQQILAHGIQEIWGIIKRPNLRMIGVEEGEKTYIKILENFPNLKKVPMNIQEAYRTPNNTGSNQHIKIKTLNIYNEKRKLKASRIKDQVIY